MRSAQIRAIRVHRGKGLIFVAKRKRPRSLLNVAFFIFMRRRPTLPHTFAYSTIGPAGLNFRVRDGNGWNPRGMIAANLGVSQKIPRLCSGFRLAAQTPPKRLNFSMRGAMSGSTSCFSAQGGLPREAKLVKEHEDDASQLNRLSHYGS